ncbi:STAS domain-containing protein [Pseudonocardia nantongensis]|uniref:STAS domain-containing protein n=1 Tax=Pseudonocardia nantongensis TaxID=1181885 RepID=UPI00397A871E
MVDPAHLEVPTEPGTIVAGATDTGPTDLGPDAGYTVVGGGATDRFECVLDTVPLDPRAPGTILVLRMAGEIDLSTQRGMQSALRAGLHARPRHLLVDLSRVGFCGVRAFSMLNQSARTAAEHQIDYALCGLSVHLERVATTLWGSAGPNRHRSTAEAVTMLRAAHAQR